VGSSHAIGLAEALQKTGAMTVLAAKLAWRISKAAVEGLVSQTAEQLETARKCSGDDIYIFQLFDNSWLAWRSVQYLPSPLEGFES
jgi:hypothetical protein